MSKPKEKRKKSEWEEDDKRAKQIKKNSKEIFRRRRYWGNGERANETELSEPISDFCSS